MPVGSQIIVFDYGPYNATSGDILLTPQGQIVLVLTLVLVILIVLSFLTSQE